MTYTELEIERPRGNACLFTNLIISNTVLCLLSIFTLAISIFLWVEIKVWDDLMMTLLAIGIGMLLISIIGFAFAKYYPTVLVIYIIFSILITICLFGIAVFIVADKDTYIEYIIKQYPSTDEVIIKDLKRVLTSNFTIIYIIFFSIAAFFGLGIVNNCYYRKSLKEKVDAENKKMREGDFLLSVSRTRQQN